MPFWPLYVWWSLGSQAFPTALWTTALTLLFLIIPLIARRSGLLGRGATPISGIANTIFTIWILGANFGTALFLAPCAARAAISFRRGERRLTIALTILPLLVFYLLQHVPLSPLHRYDAEAAKQLFALNVASIGVLAAAFGWLQCSIYQRMERTRDGLQDTAA